MKKGQQTGLLASMLIALLVITSFAYFGASYLTGIATNYGVTLNESQYAVFQEIGEVNSTIGELTSQFVNEEGSQNEDSDVITSMITGAYGVIKLIFDIPSVFSGLLQSAITALGVPPGAANVLSYLVIGTLLVMILFAAYEAVMKVRT